MKWIALALSTGLTAALTITAAHGQGMVIYPGKGQSPDQQNKDKGECHVWAVQQSGFDPAQAQAPTSTPPPSQGGERARGAARGAAAGAAVGAIAGDAGKGAAAGAAAGTVAGGSRKRQAAREQEAQNQQQQAAYAQSQAGYQRALGACLEGRGYTVR
jgi:Glycine-zipper domain